MVYGMVGKTSLTSQSTRRWRSLYRYGICFGFALLACRDCGIRALRDSD